MSGIDYSEFDRWADEHGYTKDQSAQAFADWLAELSGDRVVGMSESGMIVSKEPEGA